MENLSPQVEGTWGDYARTVIVQNGKAVRSYDTIMNAEWRRGVEMEKRLHNRMMEIVRPEMTFEELYYLINGRTKKWKSNELRRMTE